MCNLIVARFLLEACIGADLARSNSYAPAIPVPIVPISNFALRSSVTIIVMTRDVVTIIVNDEMRSIPQFAVHIDTICVNAPFCGMTQNAVVTQFVMQATLRCGQVWASFSVKDIEGGGNQMARMTARYSGTCCDCGERFSAGTLIDFTKRAPKGRKTAHADCADPGAAVTVELDQFGEALPAGVRYFEGDARPFAQTRYGWRCGYENTGMRCEDAPCCGCCG